MSIDESIDKIIKSGTIEQTEETLRGKVERPDLRIVVDFDSIRAIQGATKSGKPRSELICSLFYGSGVKFGLGFAIGEICKVPSGKAAMQQFSEIVCHAAFEPAAYGKGCIQAIASSQGEQLHVNFLVDTDGGQFSTGAYNDKGVREAIQAALPELIIGAAIDKIIKSGTIEKTEETLRGKVERPDLRLVVDFDSIRAIQGATKSGKPRSELICSLFYGSGVKFGLGFAVGEICKVPSGKAAMQQFSEIVCHAAFEPAAYGKGCIQATASSQGEQLHVNFLVDTDGGQFNADAYNDKGVREAIQAALPDVIIGAAIDKIIKSGTIEKTEETLRGKVERPDLRLVVDFDSIRAVQGATKSGKPRSELICSLFYGSGVKFGLGFAVGEICKVPSGKAAMQQFSEIVCHAAFEPAAYGKGCIQATASSQGEQLHVNFLVDTDGGQFNADAYNDKGVREAIRAALDSDPKMPVEQKE